MDSVTPDFSVQQSDCIKIMKKPIKVVLWPSRLIAGEDQRRPGYETMGGNVDYGEGGTRVDRYEKHTSATDLLGSALESSERHEDKQSHTMVYQT